MDLPREVLQYVEDHFGETAELLKTLARIPAPSNHEEKRAAFCRDWLAAQGAKGVYIDEALNVIYPVNCTADNELVVFMAHSDVVFSDTEELPLTEKDGRIYCPGVGDDTANAVVLLTAAKYVAEKGLTPKSGGMLFVINSGEEGLGNLKGSRQIMRDFGGRIRSFFSFDDCNCKVTNAAVGSKRYRIEVLTEGGHSYDKFGNRNAIAYLASMIDTLYTVKVPEGGKTTYNVGLIRGGTSVNTIAQQAEMLYEFRSDHREALLTMEKHLDAAIAFYRTKGITVNLELIGDRPCGGKVDPLDQQALDIKTAAAVKKYFGQEAKFCAASTDCNIPLSMGIPSICVGCYIGDGLHTREEYMEIDSLLPGLKMGFELVLGYYV
ncbi:MAG TPA: M20/M25/M40 family metallo-hydrolase [Clostridia bacterium]|nr:M20/M25/M40 family metallo-hydrolase [Clostridia bacterium]